MAKKIKRKGKLFCASCGHPKKAYELKKVVGIHINFKKPVACGNCFRLHGDSTDTTPKKPLEKQQYCFNA